MRNLELAIAFEHLASLLELTEESPFKIRAYRRIARTLLEMAQPIEAFAEAGRLREIPGVGEAIEAKIREFLATGHIGLLDRLTQQMPEGVLELLEIPGIGPKTARLLHEKLGVASLAELEAAARAGRVRSVKGLGERAERALLEGIERFRARAGRQPFPYALVRAEELAAAMGRLPGIGATEVTGELRRAEELVASVEMVVSAPDVQATSTAIRTLLGAEAHEESGAWEGTRRVAGPAGASLPIVVWVVPPERFASALWWSTGPAPHVKEVRLRLEGKGWRWGDGVLIGPGREGHRPRAEADIYDLAGLPWIAPELRWGQDEVRRAEQGLLPARLVELPDVRGDLHTHTRESDGIATARDMVMAARSRGLDYLAITDHSPSLAVAGGLSAERLATQVEALHALVEETGFPVLSGTEVDIRADGSLDYDVALLDRLDVVVASIHSHFRLDPETMTRRLIAACESGSVDILGHPTGRLLGRREPYRVDLDAVLQRAAETGTAIEINASPDRLDLGAEWVKRARELGARFAINTDAHSPGQLAFLRFGVAVARRAGLGAEAVVNAGPFRAGKGGSGDTSTVKG